MRIVGVPPSGGLQPYAPTSVSATAGDGQATISFTAPTWFGKNLVASSYTATSSPGGITGSGVTSGFNVTGLTNGTAYTFTVKTNTSYGVSSVASAASNSVTPVTPSSFESIATYTPTSGTSITFSSIPSTYKHLQIRWTSNTAGSNGTIGMQFNGDTGTNYVWHGLYADGVGANANSATANAYIRAGESRAESNISGVAIIDIIDYASTSKNKVTRQFSGYDTNTASAQIALRSGLWLNTAAVSSITLYTVTAAAFTNGSFALYGIKG